MNDMSENVLNVNDDDMKAVRLLNQRRGFRYSSLGKRGPKYSVSKESAEQELLDTILLDAVKTSDAIASLDMKDVMRNRTIHTYHHKADTADSEASVDKCRRKCRNGGVCVGTNKCSCPPQWRGKTCKKREYIFLTDSVVKMGLKLF